MNKYEEQSKKAQKARVKWRTCERKKAYDSEKEAEIKNQTTYRCRYCGKWHRSGSLTRLINRLKKHEKS